MSITPYITEAIGTLANAHAIVADYTRLDELDPLRYAYVASNRENAQDILAELAYPVGARASLRNGVQVTVVRNDGFWGADVRHDDGCMCELHRFSGQIGCAPPRYLCPPRDHLEDGR